MSMLSGPFCAKIASGKMSIMSLCSSRPHHHPPFPSLPFGNHRSSFIKKKKKCAEPAAEKAAGVLRARSPCIRLTEAEQGQMQTLGYLRSAQTLQGWLHSYQSSSTVLALRVLGPDNITSPNTSHTSPAPRQCVPLDVLAPLLRPLARPPPHAAQVMLAH